MSLNLSSLQDKIRLSYAIIEEYNNFTDGNLAVVMNYGLRSLCLLHLAKQVNKQIKAVYIDTGIDFPEWLKYIKKKVKHLDVIKPNISYNDLINKYGYTVVSHSISKRVEYYRNSKSPAAYKYLQPSESGFHTDWTFLIDEPFKITNKCCKELILKPMRAYAKKNNLILLNPERKRTKTGYLSNRDKTTNTAYKKYYMNIYPIAFWTLQDSLRYKENKHIKVPDFYREIVNYFKIHCYQYPQNICNKCMLCPVDGWRRYGKTKKTKFDFLKDKRPNIYRDTFVCYDYKQIYDLYRRMDNA